MKMTPQFGGEREIRLPPSILHALECRKKIRKEVCKLALRLILQLYVLNRGWRLPLEIQVQVVREMWNYFTPQQIFSVCVIGGGEKEELLKWRKWKFLKRVGFDSLTIKILHE